MAKHKKLKEFKLSLNCRCQKTGEYVDVELSPDNINHTSDPCELCGDHGRCWIDFKCPKCDGFHELELSEW